MTRSMIRWTLTGCLALSALGAVAILDVGSPTAQAAPSVSPFAGTYVREGWGPVAISNSGRISSSWGTPSQASGSISGRVIADGSYEYTLSVSYPKDPRNGEDGHKDTTTYAGTMALDVDDNLVVTSGTGGSSVWIRQ